MLLTELCSMKYCQDGLHLNFATETQQYTHRQLYGHYDLQPNEVNGKPYFKSSSYGIWWAKPYWVISDIIYVGQMFGYAFYKEDIYCPNQFSEKDWYIWGGNNWYYSKVDFVITCK